jgi:uncharacterized protein (DUF433 family)
MGEGKAYITVDARGVRRVAGTRISLDSVVIPFRQGQSPEEIQRDFPALSLEQVYGAVTYYLSHRHEVEQYLREQREEWRQRQTAGERNANAALLRLRRMKADGAGQRR